jgi:hypothetical protein
VKPFQVKAFWRIYRSKEFQRELERCFFKLQSYSSFRVLHNNFSYLSSGLILNRSSVFVCKALKIYDLYVQSLKPVKLAQDTKVADLLIRIPKFKNLYQLLQNNDLRVRDLLELNKFWDLSIKGLGPKNFAYLYYCLVKHNIRIKHCNWLLT